MPCGTPDEGLYRGCEEPSSGRGDGLLEVLGKSAVSVEPGDSPLDDPPAGQDFEAPNLVRSLDDGDHPAAQGLQGILQFLASISAISEHVPQPGKPLDDATQDDWSSVAILNVSGMDDGMNQIALGVGEDVSLAPFDLLPGVVAPWATTFRGFDALAVDHTGAGRGLAPLRFADEHEKSMVQGLPQSRIAPKVEPTAHR